eukprot:TRINITY_DN11159_c0_g1_i1.p1 TRINITY_DN11159_c0_g1~~TRINITY_DN11159_c0_g1_i1.p1  ORF type:complete len:1275 (+),score=439.06 TRINITY_DN11159_c0_g1_i1:252-4076(+)
MLHESDGTEDADTTFQFPLLIEYPVWEAPEPPREFPQAFQLLKEACAMREKYNGFEYWFAAEASVRVEEEGWPLRVSGQPFSIPSLQEYTRDYTRLLSIISSGPVKSVTYERLRMLDTKWEFHRLLNHEREESGTLHDPRDFTTVVKVDNHIHLAAAMTCKHLLQYIKKKARHDADRVVIKGKNGKEDMTLSQVFESLHVEVDSFTVNHLDTRADNTFNRFDNFNAKYNPFGRSELRSIFLKSSNDIDGEYFAGITKELFEMGAESKYLKSEYRISVYGATREDWPKLARWVEDNGLYHEVNKWAVQIPRIYPIFRKLGKVKCFQDVLDNIFLPLFAVTENPDSDPVLARLVANLGMFDSVDDESRPEMELEEHMIAKCPSAKLWTSEENPPYAFQMYYLWVNLLKLNIMRHAKGMNTIALRPHCGESGSVNHLASAFMVAKSINHGINLEKSTPLQYLYYLEQVGMSVSPLSNNSLFLDYKRNPFFVMFRRGLNATLSTDDPLQFHYTNSPLIEEYSVASQRWGLSGIDMSEIARASVLQSAFEHHIKQSWLGEHYLKGWHFGNDVAFSNIPDLRLAFRHRVWHFERVLLLKFGSGLESSTALRTAAVSTPSLVAHHQKELQRQLKEGRVWFARVGIEMPESEHRVSTSTQMVCEMMKDALELRAKWKRGPMPLSRMKPSPDAELAPASEHMFRMVRGVFEVYEGEKATEPMRRIPNFAQFVQDTMTLAAAVDSDMCASFCRQRLGMLEARYKTHKLLNAQREKEGVQDCTVDFYHVKKVDNHIHLNTGMGCEHLREFIKSKIRDHPDDVVWLNPLDNSPVTLKSVFADLGVAIDHVTIDSLSMRADSTFHRFEGLKLRCDPFGQTDLRAIFLRRNNHMEGRYLAELTREMLAKSQKNSSTLTEFRLSIYGRDAREWEDLASWVDKHQLYHSCNRWIIQVSRCFDKVWNDADTMLETFEQLLDNMFRPLFEVSVDPESNPTLAKFLSFVSSFDTVNDESIPESPITPHAMPPTPDNWRPGSGVGTGNKGFDLTQNPPYSYYLYYLWANIEQLNRLRRANDLNEFALRPHCGQSGSVTHLMAGYLLADNINHGLQLEKSPVLEYLYYLQQIGISLSPVAENKVFLKYENNPFMGFFKRGLLVSLSTDNPVLQHITEEPLLEEYSIAAQMYRLSECDLSELAANSVLMSGYSHEEKCTLLGKHYAKGKFHIDHKKTNLPYVRSVYRQECLQEEIDYIEDVLMGDIAVSQTVFDVARPQRFKAIHGPSNPRLVANE